MSTVPSQADCFVSVTTPFGADVLLLDGFGGREAISEPFHFDLRMHSTNKALDAQTIIGKGVTVTVKDQVGTARYFNGIVKRFAHTGANSQYGFYSAELAPRLWLLTLGQDRMIYQNQSALDIIKAVLGTFQVPLELRISGDYAVREYCVQYDESAFAFISRLMEEEGIFYFFTFANGAHTMVLADSPSAHEVGQTTLYFSPDSSVAPRAERVAEFAMTQDIVSGVHVLADYDYLTAASSTASSSGSVSVPTGRRFTFPGKYATSAEGTRKSAVRLAAQTVQQQTGRGAGYCYALTAGTSFTLSGHVNSALNVSYVVRAVTHTASNSSYSNEFNVFPESVPFRAPLTTPRPVVAGTHTAKVVGSSGEEIWTDSNGRVKLKFYWDGSAGANENSSCWVRVSQSSAGQGWGHLFLPRIGQEVVVSYVDGDPDRPLVTGSVYNGENATPVALPSMQTQSVMRSRSSKGGTAGNEIRMEDKLDSEELYFHAQKDMNVAIENALTTTVIAGAESHVIQKGDRTIDVQTGKETHTVKGTRTLDVTGDETHTNHAAFTQNVSGNYTLKVTGNLVIDVTGSISIKAGTSLASEGGTTHASKAGTTLSSEGMTISHKASATQTVDGGGMLALKGGLVKLN